MTYKRPTLETKCKCCGAIFAAERFRVLRNMVSCCSKSCRGKIAASKQKNPGRKPTHGACRNGVISNLYQRWSSMKMRCYSRNVKGYKRYGARGITVCKEWRDSFEKFRDWAINNGYKKELQIDRIDNDKGYYPGNCRWVTARENSNNRRNSIIFPSGETVAEVAERLGMNPVSIRYRLKSGMSVDEAMNLPPVPNGNERRTFKKR